MWKIHTSLKINDNESYSTEGKHYVFLYVYLRNTLQNDISKITSELNMLTVQNISDVTAAILHQNSSPYLFQTCLHQMLICTISRCWKRSVKLFIWKELQDAIIIVQTINLCKLVNDPEKQNNFVVYSTLLFFRNVIFILNFISQK